MSEFLARTYYGNSVEAWGISMLIVLGSVIIAKILYWFLSTIVKQLAKKTKSKLDDILVDMLEEPIVAAIVIAGFWYGFKRLDFSVGVNEWFAHVFQIAFTLNITWMLVRVFDSLVEEYVVPLTEKSKSDLDDQLLPILRKGIKTITWIMGVIIALNNAGFDVGALIAGLGIGGLALAMAAKDTVSNIFGGFTIFTDKPFMLNDRINTAGYDGTVEEIGIRSTRLRTLEGRQVTIPNSKFSDGIVENISSEPSRKIVLNLGLTYDMDDKKIELAMKLLKEIAANNSSLEENVLTGFNAFGDYALNIIFIYYIKSGEDILGTQTNMNLEIMRKFAANGLEFAFPSQTVYTKSLN